TRGTCTVRGRSDEPAEGAIADSAARVNFLSDSYDKKAATAPAKLVVPKSAVAERNGGKVVWVLDAGRVSMRNIEVGEEFGGGYVLKTEIPSGTKVVADPPAD